MKKLVYLLAALVVAVGLVVGPAIVSGAPASTNPTVVIANPIAATRDEDRVIPIMGCGFEPGQELIILIVTPDGLKSHIDYSLDSAPVANESGAWVVAWTVERMGRVVPIGAVSIEVADTDYNTLAATPIAFYDARKKPEDRPAWAPKD